MEYFVVMEAYDKSKACKCFKTYDEALSYIEPLTCISFSSGWGLFQWKENHLTWLEGSSIKDISRLLADICIPAVLDSDNNTLIRF